MNAPEADHIALVQLTSKALTAAGMPMMMPFWPRHSAIGGLDHTCLAMTLHTGSIDGSERCVLHDEPIRVYSNLIQKQMQQKPGTNWAALPGPQQHCSFPLFRAVESPVLMSMLDFHVLPLAWLRSCL